MNIIFILHVPMGQHPAKSGYNFITIKISRYITFSFRTLVPTPFRYRYILIVCACVYVCIHVCMCAYVCMCVCACVCMCVLKSAKQ